MKVDIKASSMELAELIQQDKNLIEKDLLKSGQDLVAIFEDPNFSDKFQNFRELKRDVFCMVLEDLAMGGQTLKSSSVGLTFSDGKIKTFITPFGSSAQGNLMFSVSLKNTVAFQNWRKSENKEDMPQDELNAALYRIVVALAEVI